MKSGEFIYARTHAAFLNQAFGTNYKAWMKSSWNYNGGWTIWMVRFNRNIDGWENSFISEGNDPYAVIMQDNLNGKDTFEGIPINYATTKKRIVFEIDEKEGRRKYIFRGKYVYDEAKSDARTVQYLNKISDEL